MEKKTEKITGSEIRQMIKEEYAKRIKAIDLKKRLKTINEEIAKLEGCDLEEKNVEEVKTGGETKVKATAWTGEKGGDTKFKPEFEKKMAGGRVAALKEDESAEISVEEPIEEPVADETPVEEDVIQKVLDGLKDVLDKPETAGEVKAAIEGEPTEETPVEIPGEEMPGEDSIEGKPEEEPIEEKVVEEQDGVSVAQAVDPKKATPYDNGKADIPKTRLNEEQDRMAVLAGLKKSPING